MNICVNQFCEHCKWWTNFTEAHRTSYLLKVWYKRMLMRFYIVQLVVLLATFFKMCAIAMSKCVWESTAFNLMVEMLQNLYFWLLMYILSLNIQQSMLCSFYSKNNCMSNSNKSLNIQIFINYIIWVVIFFNWWKMSEPELSYLQIVGSVRIIVLILI